MVDKYGVLEEVGALEISLSLLDVQCGGIS